MPSTIYNEIEEESKLSHDIQNYENSLSFDIKNRKEIITWKTGKYY